MVMWVMQRRAGFSVLVHPNSGCDIEDHSKWAIWGGLPWQIDLEFFKRKTPQNKL